MAKKQVAVVVSGGASLGAYMAGALDELFRAFQAVPNQYEIDIITGASAGATTGALLAHSLLYRADQPAFEQVWVDQVDIAGLLSPDPLPAPGADPTTAVPPALLNGSYLHDLAARTLSWNAGPDQPVRAACVADQLTLAMTLSNTTGLPYSSRVPQPAVGDSVPFVQMRHAEQETFALPQTLAPSDPLWMRVGEVARASAAIPFAFPLVPLRRRLDDPRQYIQLPELPAGQEGTFWYYDGGTYNNLPVDLAWYFIQQRGGDLKNRVMVVVNPLPAGAGGVNLNPTHPSLFSFAFGLIGALLTESSALQFDHEVLAAPSQAQQATTDDGTRALAGVDRAPVELLADFALVRTQDPHIRGTHLSWLAAFLDRRFREYDFRRGAADAQQTARDLLKIDYDAGRPAGFYQPENDTALGPDIPTYSALDQIPSSADSTQTVRAAFEAAVDRRARYLIADFIRRAQPSGPDLVYDTLLDNLYTRVRPWLFEQIAKSWG